jgi:hypothetical protein
MVFSESFVKDLFFIPARGGVVDFIVCGRVGEMEL